MFTELSISAPCQTSRDPYFSLCIPHLQHIVLFQYCAPRYQPTLTVMCILCQHTLLVVHISLSAYSEVINTPCQHDLKYFVLHFTVTHPTLTVMRTMLSKYSYCDVQPAVGIFPGDRQLAAAYCQGDVYITLSAKLIAMVQYLTLRTLIQ